MAKGKRKFKFQDADRSVETVMRKSKQSGGNYDSYIDPEVVLFKPREGENNIRILPRTWDDTERWDRGWDIGVKVHYGIGPDEATYLCLDDVLKEPCPICDARNSGTLDPDEADELKPTWRGLCWIIDRDNEKAGPMVWSMPVTLFRDIQVRSVNKSDNTSIVIDNDEEGYDVFFTKEGTGLRTKYISVEIDRDPTPIHEDEDLQERWLEYIMDRPLPDILKTYEYDYIEKILLGKAASSRGRDDDDGEEEEPDRRRGAAKRRSRRGDDDGEEDYLDGEEDTEEEEKPRRERRSRRRGRDDDEEEEEEKPRRERRSRRRGRDEEEEDDDGEEEEKPRRERRRTRRRGDVEEEVEEEEEKPRRERRRTSRRGRDEEEEAEEEETEDNDDDPSDQARGKLDRMSRRRGRKRGR